MNRRSVYYLLFSAVIAVMLFFDAKELIQAGVSSRPYRSIFLSVSALTVIILVSKGLREFRYCTSICWDAENLKIEKKNIKRALKWSEVTRVQEDLLEYHIRSENDCISIKKSDLDAELAAFIKTKT